MLKKIERKTENDLLLNLKDISSFKSSNMNEKQEDKALTIDSTLEKYNRKYIEAQQAPVPKINLPYSEVLIRAVPKEIKSSGGLIISLGENEASTDYNIANQLNKMSHAVSNVQEILLVGGMVTKEEQDGGIRVGLMCKLNMNGFRSIHDRMAPGVIEHEYSMPLHHIDGYDYMIINKRDVLYTYEK